MNSLKCFLLFAAAAAIAPGIAQARLASTADDARPLGVGNKVPAATIVNASGERVDLADALGGKPTLLVFYRGGWCPYCNKHLAKLSELEEKLVAMGYQILGVSPDPVGAVAEAAAKSDAGYALFSDRGMEASSAFGLAFRVDAETQEKYSRYGIDLAPVPGEPDARWLPVPAAYIVGRDGSIRFVYTNSDYKTRVSNDEVLEAARAAAE